jgi:hypothetical protein
MEEIAILKTFAGIKDSRRGQGKMHSLPLCLALFTLGVAAGNRGMIAIGDWILANYFPLAKLFKVSRLPSYPTIWRVLNKLDHHEFNQALASFFGASPQPLDTIALDGKALRGSYERNAVPPYDNNHPAILLVNAYWLEGEASLGQYQVDRKTNEIKALPEFIEKLALHGVVFTFDAINTQKKP